MVQENPKQVTVSTGRGESVTLGKTEHVAVRTTGKK